MSITINNFPEMVQETGLSLDLNLEPGSYELDFRSINDTFVLTRENRNGYSRYIYEVSRQEITARHSCRMCLTSEIDQSIYNREGFDERNAQEIEELYNELDAIWQSRQTSLAGGCSFSGRTNSISWLTFINLLR